MKKLLTILGTISLTATTASTVVGCQIKKVQTIFQNLNSITPDTWKGEKFGTFSSADFESSTIESQKVYLIKSDKKPKIASYVAAGFSNYQKAFTAIMNENTQIFIYKKQKYTNDFVAPESDEKLKELIINQEEIFFQIINLVTGKKSSYLNLNVAVNDQTEAEFILESWFNEGEKTIEISKNDFENTKNEQKTAVLNQLSTRIVDDWKFIRGQESTPTQLGGIDGIINNFCNYVGEYLVQIEGYASQYGQENEIPLTLKEQLKNTFKQNKEKKEEVRSSVYEWFTIDINNKQQLSLTLYLDNTSKKINLDFSEKE